MSFDGSRSDVASGDYDLQQLLRDPILGLDADPNVLRSGLTPADPGFFVPNVTAPSLSDSVLPSQASTEDVVALQLALNAKDNAGLTVDGRYGPATTDAVEAFQKQHGLTVDGLAGPPTIAAIKALT
jgi:peptidoglycan hydrolase-like protein with peptidoglycan-binding domain